MYLANIVALYIARYASAIIYGAAIQLYWKVHADDGHPDEYDFVLDHRYINAWTTATATCLAAATLVLTQNGAPTWMTHWWAIIAGTAVIGSMTTESLLSFTPMWFYIKILRRFPQRNR